MKLSIARIRPERNQKTDLRKETQFLKHSEQDHRIPVLVVVAFDTCELKEVNRHRRPASLAYFAQDLNFTANVF